MKNTHFLRDSQIHQKVIIEKACKAKQLLWIATSDIKDMHVKKGQKWVPFLEILAGLIQKGVNVRIIHAKEPGKRFRDDFDRYEVLFKNIEMMLCPRVHFKSVIIDSKFAYTGSANLTGAGLGGKSDNKRNFEAGIITTDPNLVAEIENQFDQLWMQKFCKTCGRKHFCDQPGEI